MVKIKTQSDLETGTEVETDFEVSGTENRGYDLDSDDHEDTIIENTPNVLP